MKARIGWKRTLFAAALMVAPLLAALSGPAGAAPIPPPVPTTGWLLDEGSGLTLSQFRGTRSGLLGGHVAPPVAPPTWSTDTPLFYPGDHSLSFVGTGVGVPSNWAELDGHTSATKGTVSFWVRDEDGGSPRYVLDASDGHRTLMYRTGGLDTFVNQAFIGTVNGNLVPGPGAGSPWTHVAIVWDSSLATDKEKIYKNGLLFETKNVAIGAKNPAKVYLGSRFSKNEGWGGKIDEYALWNNPLSPDEVAWLAGHSLRHIPTTPPGIPAAAWLFDDGAGSTAHARFGGQGGTLYSNVGWTTNTPYQRDANDRALWFDGTADNRVNFPGHTFGTAGSISLWAYRQGGAQYLFDASPGGRSLLYSHYSLFLNDTFIGGVNGEFIPDNEWTHLVFTWDNSLASDRIKLFKNGALFTTFNQLLSAKSPAMLWLGNRYSNNEPWRGAIDEYALWDYALDLREVGWLYQNSLLDLPEPGTMSLLALGGIGALIRRRRRRRSNSSPDHSRVV